MVFEISLSIQWHTDIVDLTGCDALNQPVHTVAYWYSRFDWMWCFKSACPYSGILGIVDSRNFKSALPYTGKPSTEGSTICFKSAFLYSGELSIASWTGCLKVACPYTSILV